MLFACYLGPMNSSNSDYVAWLNREFNGRCLANPLYSKRAFARDLKLSPASMSYILSGQKNLSPSSAKRVAKAIALNIHDTEVFCALVQLSARSRSSRESAQKKLIQLQYLREIISLDLDKYKTIADWHHLAILKLVRIKNFKTDSTWIGLRLGISSKEVDAAILRLEQLGLLLTKNEQFQVPKEIVYSPDSISSEPIQKYHRQILEKANHSIESQSDGERYLNTSLLPVRIKDLPRAKEKIKEFHREFDAEFSPKLGEFGDQVYALAVQLFSLTPESPN